jgi:N-acyl-L-homoserine lactone synthetase
MIFVVNSDNRGQYSQYIQEMHRHRKLTFIDELRWGVPASGDCEVDTYDRSDTLYLLACRHDGAPLLASARLLPTSGPHLMRDHFAHACEALPCGVHVWEASRFVTSRTVVGSRARLTLLWEIIAGIIETALLFDIEQVTFTANRALLPAALACGWEARRLGPTLPDGEDEITAVAAQVTQAGLRRVKQRIQRSGPVIRLHAPHAIAA